VGGVYTIPEIKVLLRSQPEDAHSWLTTSQMGWALTRERNEITNEKDERDGKPVARQLVQMISKFIRAQWESPQRECMDDERLQILEEAAELDHIWGAWEAEAEPINDPNEWLTQPSLSRVDVRYHVEVHASHREQWWEPPSVSLTDRDPEVIPDGDIAVHMGKDFFFDEKIPRHESCQGYVRVVEHSVLWKENEASKVFTYQGLTTCTEVNKSWTTMSGAYNHVRSKRGKDERSMAMFIRKEVQHQELLEAAGYRSPTWRVLRSLKSLLSATQLQGESAVAAPPFFPNAGRGTVRFWGNEQGPKVFLWDGLDEEGWKKRKRTIQTRKRLGCVEPSAANERGLRTKRV
jgi:hypothetical protein